MTIFGLDPVRSVLGVEVTEFLRHCVGHAEERHKGEEENVFHEILVLSKVLQKAAH